MNTREENVPSPTSPDKIVVELGTVCVLRRRHLRVLAESADQLLERFGVWSCVICLALERRIAMAGVSRSGQMFLCRKSGEAMSERPSCHGNGPSP